MTISYNADHLSFTEQIELLKYCNSVCYNWWLDNLGRKQLIRREFISSIVENKNFDQALTYCKPNGRLTVIRRPEVGIHKSYLEICMNSPLESSVEYFLWICVDLYYLNDIITKFNLKER